MTDNQSDIIFKLKEQSRHFGVGSAREKKRLLKLVSGKLTSPDANWLELHETLLFIMAYPENRTIYNHAAKGMESLTNSLKSFFHDHYNKAVKLFSNTGVFNMPVCASFGYRLTEWLRTGKYGSCFTLSVEAEPDDAMNIFRQLMPFLEKEKLENTFTDAGTFLEELGGLAFLMNLLGQTEGPEAYREHLFNGLQIFIQWEPEHYSRSLLQLPFGEVYYYRKGTDRKFPEPGFYDNTRLKKIHISNAQSAVAADISRAMLASMLRETDPVTFADDVYTEAFSMENGITVVLFYIRTDQRMLLESYIGYMLFKNRIPAAYGGAWLFGTQAKIGVNIFPSFRGGESPLIFASLIALYRKEFGVHHFIAEPYQLGHHNEEGIKSGAFWFYYRLGFRPVEKSFALMAEKEWNKITGKKGYKTPRSILVKLASGKVCLSFTHHEAKLCDPQQAGFLLMKQLKKVYAGRNKKPVREKKESVYNQEISSDAAMWQGKKAYLHAFFRMLPPEIFRKYHKTIIKLVNEKTEGSERKYQELLTGNEGLLKNLNALLHEG